MAVDNFGRSCKVAVTKCLNLLTIQGGFCCKVAVVSGHGFFGDGRPDRVKQSGNRRGAVMQGQALGR